MFLTSPARVQCPGEIRKHSCMPLPFRAASLVGIYSLLLLCFVSQLWDFGDDILQVERLQNTLIGKTVRGIVRRAFCLVSWKLPSSWKWPELSLGVEAVVCLVDDGEVSSVYWALWSHWDVSACVRWIFRNRRFEPISCLIIIITLVTSRIHSSLSIAAGRWETTTW